MMNVASSRVKTDREMVIRIIIIRMIITIIPKITRMVRAMDKEMGIRIIQTIKGISSPYPMARRMDIRIIFWMIITIIPKITRMVRAIIIPKIARIVRAMDREMGTRIIRTIIETIFSQSKPARETDTRIIKTTKTQISRCKISSKKQIVLHPVEETQSQRLFRRHRIRMASLMTSTRIMTNNIFRYISIGEWPA
jgi:hypothetical protein